MNARQAIQGPFVGTLLLFNILFSNQFPKVNFKALTVKQESFQKFVEHK